MVLSKKKAKKNKDSEELKEDILENSIDLDDVVSKLVKEGKIFNMSKKEIEIIINSGLKREIEKLKINSFVKVLDSKDVQIKYLIKQTKKLQKQISIFKGIDFVVQLAEESKINFTKAKSLIAKLDLVEEENIVNLLYKIKDKIDVHDENIQSYDKKVEEINKLIASIEKDMKAKHSLKEINFKIDKITKTDQEMEKHVQKMNGLTSRFNTKISSSVKKSVEDLGKELSDKIDMIENKSMTSTNVKSRFDGFKREATKVFESKLKKDLSEIKNSLLLKFDTDIKSIDKKLVLNDTIVVDELNKDIVLLKKELTKSFNDKLKLGLRNTEKGLLIELDSKFSVLQSKAFKQKAEESVKPEVDKKYVEKELLNLRKDVSKVFENKFSNLNKNTIVKKYVDSEMDSFRNEINNAVADKISSKLKFNDSNGLFEELNNKISVLEQKLTVSLQNKKSTPNKESSKQDVSKEINILKENLTKTFENKLETKFKQLESKIILNSKIVLNNKNSNLNIDNKIQSLNNKVTKSNVDKKDVVLSIKKEAIKVDDRLYRFESKLDSSLEFINTKVRNEIDKVNNNIDNKTKNLGLKINSKFIAIENKMSAKFKEIDNLVKMRINEINKDMKIINGLMNDVDGYKQDLNYKIKKVDIMYDSMDDLMLRNSIGKKSLGSAKKK